MGQMESTPGPSPLMEPGYIGYDAGLPFKGQTPKEIIKAQVQPIRTGVIRPSSALLGDIVAPPIVSGPEVSKRASPLGGEIWGPYNKAYAETFLGYGWRLPENIDGVIPVCQCRDIKDWVRGDGSEAQGSRISLTSYAAFLRGNIACVQDIANLWVSPDGGPQYNLIVNHRDFNYYFINSKGLVGIASDVLKGKNPVSLSALLGGKGSKGSKGSRNKRRIITQKNRNRKNKIKTQKRHYRK